MRSKGNKELRNISDDFKKFLRERGMEYKEIELKITDNFEDLEKTVEDLFNGEYKHYKILDYVSDVDTTKKIVTIKFVCTEE